MNWQEVIENTSLRNLPFKIETDETGKIIMSAVRVKHSLYQGEIAFLMRTMRQNGFVMSECAVKTQKGTKAADVAWASIERVLQIRDAIEAFIAPEVCVEVLSASHATEEVNEKRALYFESGAIEFWTCSENGTMQFFNAGGSIEQSILFPHFPAQVEI